MTREEAIAFFKDMKECTYGNLKAVDMAIKALEQEPCEDCVSRQAIEFVNEVIGGKNDLADAIRDGVEAVLSALPPVIPTQKWIPVSEELPKEPVYKEFVEPSEPVLIQLNNGEMKVSRYWGSRESYKDEPWIDLSYPTTLEVVAWMPLPEPYKAEMESEDGH